MPELRVRISERNSSDIVSKITKYYQILDTEFINTYLPKKYNYTLVEENEPADICIVGIQHVDNSLLRENEINIVISMENLGCGRRHYKFHNVFGDTGNKQIHIHLYNHYNHVVYLDNQIKILPVVDFRIRNYLEVKDRWKEELTTDFHKKKFCLFASSNGLNENKHRVYQELSMIGHVDLITDFKDTLGDKSCVHGYDLIRFLNQYKFIICFENSNTAGYMTEKIFNVFHARSIPIYNGAPDIDTYINPQSYLKYDPFLKSKVELLNQNKKLYDHIVQTNKISREIDTEIMNNYLDKYLNK